MIRIRFFRPGDLNQRTFSGEQFGAGIMIQVFNKTLGWVPIHRKCGLVRGRSSLDAELGGCGMLMEILLGMM